MSTSTPRFQWRGADGKDQVFMIASPEVVIGRKTDADISIANQHVSRHHAKVVSMPTGGHQIVDLGSTYGTFVNGQRIETRILSHGDRVTFGRDEVEFHYLTEAEAAVRNEADTTRIVQKSFKDLGRVLPSAVSDLEKIQVILDFQHQWNQVFTPENGLDQILDSALKISGAERAFIMTRKTGEFGYAAGMDGKGKRLSESDFQASQSIIRDVVSHGRPVFMVEGIDRDFAEQESIVAMNLRAIACLPLRGIPTEGDSPEILGILYLDSTKAMHSLSGLDQRILSKLAVEAGNVLERVEMIKSIEHRKNLERDLSAAEEIQRSILPREIPKLDHLKLDASSKATRYVGGDFYHFHVSEVGDAIGVLADVSGKGIAASLLSSMLLGCLQLLLSGGDGPEAAMNRLNKFLHEKQSGKFATMFVFSVNAEGRGQFISAGHNPAYLFRASKNEIEELHSNCMILGAFDFAMFQASPLEMHEGDVLIAYSDGLTEAEDPAGEMFGEERVKDIIKSEAAQGSDKLHKALLSGIEQFTRGRAQTDDITIMIAERS